MLYLHTPIGKKGRWPAVATTVKPTNKARRRRPIVTTDLPESMHTWLKMTECKYLWMHKTIDNLIFFFINCDKLTLKSDSKPVLFKFRLKQTAYMQ